MWEKWFALSLQVKELVWKLVQDPSAGQVAVLRHGFNGKYKLVWGDANFRVPDNYLYVGTFVLPREEGKRRAAIVATLREWGTLPDDFAAKDLPPIKLGDDPLYWGVARLVAAVE